MGNRCKWLVFFVPPTTPAFSCAKDHGEEIGIYLIYWQKNRFRCETILSYWFTGRDWADFYFYEDHPHIAWSTHSNITNRVNYFSGSGDGSNGEVFIDMPNWNRNSFPALVKFRFHFIVIILLFLLLQRFKWKEKLQPKIEVFLCMEVVAILHLPLLRQHSTASIINKCM